METIIHVYPINEDDLHDLVGSRCRCIPEVWVDADGGVVISHNSFDGREWHEEGYVRLN